MASDAKRKRVTTKAGTGAKKRASQARKVRMAEKRAKLEAEQIEAQRTAAGIVNEGEPRALPAIPEGATDPATGDDRKSREALSNQYGGLLEGERKALDATGLAADTLVNIMQNRRNSPDVRRKAANDLLAVAQNAKARERPEGNILDRKLSLRDLLELREALVKQRDQPQTIDVTPEPG